MNKNQVMGTVKDIAGKVQEEVRTLAASIENTGQGGRQGQLRINSVVGA